MTLAGFKGDRLLKGRSWLGALWHGKGETRAVSVLYSHFALSWRFTQSWDEICWIGQMAAGGMEGGRKGGGGGRARR